MNTQDDISRCEVSGKLLNVSELSQHLGVKVKTVYCWIHARQIPYIKVGRLVKFDPLDISQWVESKKVRLIRG